MTVTALSISDYRNIEKLELKPSPGVNIIYGNNAQGKTNLLESIWLFTGCRSFRGTKDSQLIRFGSAFSSLKLDFFASGREQTAEIIIENQRRAKLNGVLQSSPSKLCGEFTAVIFSPAHLSLVEDGPSERRKFLDTALCQLSIKYAKALSEYNRILLQRNSLLKDIYKHRELLDTLEIWDLTLSEAAAVILQHRLKYHDKLKSIISEIYSGISSSKEDITLTYRRKIPEGLSVECSLAEILRAARKEDIASGSTNYGIHRDDLGIEINGMAARDFGSQGQKRSAALALKLAEAKIIKDATNEQPVALLDDVMSELDENRQDYILNHIKGWQVFITCCDMNTRLRMCEGESFHISEGRISD